MSKRISFRGKLDDGLQDRLTLKTIKGKIGYRIVKFQCISDAPASTTSLIVCKIFKKDQTGSIGPTIDFTDSNLMAVVYLEEHSNSTDYGGTNIIFDNEIVNQNIFVTASDGSGGTKACNYYIELETVELTDVQATQLTLRSIKTIIADPPV